MKYRQASERSDYIQVYTGKFAHTESSRPFPTVSLLNLLEGPLALAGSLGEQPDKLPEGCSNIYPWIAFPSRLYSCSIINGFVFLLTTTVCFHCCLNEVPQIRVHTHQIHTTPLFMFRRQINYPGVTVWQGSLLSEGSHTAVTVH